MGDLNVLFISALEVKAGTGGRGAAWLTAREGARVRFLGLRCVHTCSSLCELCSTQRSHVAYALSIAYYDFIVSMPCEACIKAMVVDTEIMYGEPLRLALREPSKRSSPHPLLSYCL